MVRHKQNFSTPDAQCSSSSMQRQQQEGNDGFKAPDKKSGMIDERVQSSLKKRSDFSKKECTKIEKRNSHKRKSCEFDEIINLDEIDLDDPNSRITERITTPNYLAAYRERLKMKESPSYLIANKYDVTNVEPYKLSDFNINCNHCPALHFAEEQSKTHGVNEFLGCCNYGKLANLEEFIQDYPIELRVLFQPELDIDNYTRIGELHRDFKQNIRALNSSFSCASLGCMRFRFPDKNIPIFKIQGSVYHSYNSAAQAELYDLPTNGQLYFIDTDQAIDFRINAFDDRVHGDPHNKTIEVIAYIESYLREHYIYSQSYEMMKDVYEKAVEQARSNGTEIPNISMLFDIKEGTDLRRYNIPRSNEVCAILWRDANDDIPAANIIVHSKSNKKINTIYPLSPFVEPLCYPLFYPNNYRGWHYDLKGLNGKKISLCDFTKYKLFFRNGGKFLPHHYSGKLFQQWCVDQAARIEWDRLNYIKLHQKEICKETYSAVDKFLQAKAIEEGANVKKQIILPSSFTGGPRNMHESFMDAMAIVNEVGKPDLFITFTCNPKDEDIQKNLLPGQQAYDRPDIVARVFRLKVIQFLKEIVQEKILGKVSGFCYTIEFQKRGLPHLHMLLTLDANNKWKNTDDIDKFISAEIPDENEDKVLYDLVTSLMMHGPCGPDFPESMCWCQKKKRCSKKFPKVFREKTELNENGYPLYKRPNNGRSINKKDWRTGKSKTMTNQDVVPYNRYLLKRFKAHINIEKVADIKAVKYIYKYIFKGYDAAMLRCVTNENGQLKELIYDEAGNYLDARYLSPVEACWKIFKYPLQEKSHSVQRLPVHLENEQIIYFDENDEEEIIMEKRDKKSKLMAYFDFFNENPQAEKYLYPDMPKYCTWNSKLGQWHLRKYNLLGKTIGRMYPVNPTEGEKYYLRYLLLHIHGTSFKDLKTVNGILYNTFAQACMAHGLVKNDDEWIFCLTEASHFRFPPALRNLFASILLYGDPKYPEKLWEKFKDNLSEDYLRNNTPKNSYKLALFNIDRHLLQGGKSLAYYQNMPQEILQNNNEIDQIDYKDEERNANELYTYMNDEQKKIFDIIKQVANDELEQKLIYIDGPGGTGKSYILNALYHLINSHKKHITNMAFSGIAATLLKSGRTLHNRFKLPLNLNAESLSGIVAGTKEADEILKSDFYVIDEAPMAPRFVLNMIDKKLRELTKSNKLFGGKTMILAGDFRQTLPIKKFSTRSEIVDLTLKKSTLWNHFQIIKLKKNKRAIDQKFAEEVLNIGNGCDYDGFIYPPKQCILLNDSNLVDEIYGDIFVSQKFCELKNRMILSPYNDLTDYYNDIALEKFPGDYITYLSIDEVETTANFPVTPEIMNSFNSPGFPLHKLSLKKNCKVMLLRNINIQAGLCNGTILQVIELKKHVLRCVILGGDKNGCEAYIHRVSLITESEFPVPLKRHQFPLRLAFAATFIKGQGATYKRIGIDWTKPSFSHGQTYVAISRVGSWDQIKIKLSPENTDMKVENIVWKEIL